MALSKKIIKPNGLELNYHRIGMLKIDTNQQITILIHSYLSEEGRNYEKKYENGEIEGEPTFPFVHSEYMSFPYDESVNIKSAYERLKSTSEFEGATDV